MDDCSKIVLKKLCCTCLSQDRKLTQLCRLKEGLNNLYSLLSHDTEAYREGFFKYTASWYICWECWAIMRRISKFRSQVCLAQHQLTDILEGGNDLKLFNTCLSHLSVTQTDFLNLDITEQDSNNFINCSLAVKTEADIDTEQDTDNFIDCGLVMRTEADIDIPMSLSPSISDADDGINPNEPLPPQIVKVEIEPILKHRINKKTIVKSIKRNEPSPKPGNTTVRSIKVIKEAKPGTKSQDATVRSMKTAKPGTKPENLRKLRSKTTVEGYQCPECDMFFKNARARRTHVMKYHREWLQCDQCKKRFVSKGNLKRHIMLHKGPVPREECPICHKMVRVIHLKYHIRRHQDKNKYYCVECDKTYSNVATYQGHLKYSRAHASDSVFKHKCPVCDKGYKRLADLKDHVNYHHVGETQHKCPICGKALASRRCVAKHVKKAHDGYKEKKDKICQQCGKAFTLKRMLREHELIHTGERPLSCDICGDTFRQKASLYTHKRRVHNVKCNKKIVTLMETAPSSGDSKH